MRITFLLPTLASLLATGAFAQVTSYDFRTFQAAGTALAIDDIKSVDLDGDGDSDLVASMQSTFTGAPTTVVACVYNSGNGILQTDPITAVFNLAPSTVPTILEVGDFDTDGRQDVAMLSSPGGVPIFTVMTNPGITSGTLVPLPPVGAPALTTDFLAIDVENDGDADIVSRQTGFFADTLTVLNNSGAGALTVAAVSPLGVSSFGVPSQMVVGDLDGLGIRDDLVLTGAATFLGPTAIDVAFNDLASLFGTGPGTYGSPFAPVVLPNTSSVGCADLNGDSYDDIAVQIPGVTYYALNGGPQFTFPFVYPFSPTSIVQSPNSGGSAGSLMASGDLDSIGGVDVVTTNPTAPSSMSAGLNLGGGSAFVGLSGSISFTPTSLETGQFNAASNGNADVVAGTATSLVWFILL